MSTYYYLSVFPMEALIASQLEPDQFATYMAIGSKKGSQEQIIFIEIDGGFAGAFDWKHAEEKCIPNTHDISRVSICVAQCDGTGEIVKKSQNHSDKNEKQNCKVKKSRPSESNKIMISILWKSFT